MSLVTLVGMVGVVGVVEMVRLVEVNRVVEVVYRHEENLGVKGPNNNNKDVGLPMTMPQAAGKKSCVGKYRCTTLPVTLLSK